MSSQDTSISTQRRKALIRQYKQTPKAMGVYAIRNTSNGKLYIGSSRDLRARVNRHQMDLKTNSDRSSAQLQQDWNQFGAAAFEFETLEQLDPLDDAGYDPGEDLELLEALWLEKLKPFVPDGYNRPTD